MNYNKLVIELFCAIDTSEWRQLTTVFHSNIIYERPGYVPFVGISQLLNFYQKERIIKSGKHYIEYIAIEGNYGACWGRFVGSIKDGSQVDELFADTYFFEDRKIKNRRSYFFRPAI
ncbi:hypothetical protein PQG02_36310 (plasmid) [Nostoc sp. UHCC 0926]|uniref:nuclear transport factor 2 family protein n=1 Tax=Nostoc sp. UHCC 0926 TaxID=3025190 RepID=UPI0023611EF2|nr:nuclear transport factor 2 family protein [Nostoc sp. UHCC 0926]WDD36591.1 hypothetical protein PQG02_36310 [Nostoc sp. UHCC 0926]